MNDKKDLFIRIKLVKSIIGTKKKHRDTVSGLGLTKLNSISVVVDTPDIRGMIRKVNYLIKFI